MHVKLLEIFCTTTTQTKLASYLQITPTIPQWFYSHPYRTTQSQSQSFSHVLWHYPCYQFQCKFHRNTRHPWRHRHHYNHYSHYSHSWQEKTQKDQIRKETQRNHHRNYSNRRRWKHCHIETENTHSSTEATLTERGRNVRRNGRRVPQIAYARNQGTSVGNRINFKSTIHSCSGYQSGTERDNQ